jgi:hypothetical protein
MEALLGPGTAIWRELTGACEATSSFPMSRSEIGLEFSMLNGVDVMMPSIKACGSFACGSGACANKLLRRGVL